MKNSFFKKLAKRRGNVVCDKSKCVYCETCMKNCPVGALTVDLKNKTREIDNELCIRCGHCIKSCPMKALKMGK